MSEAGNAVLPKVDYEVIDTDPHFSRVVGYFRPSDYTSWALFTASGPAILAAIEYFESKGNRLRVSPGALRASLALGFSAGFFNAYTNSSLRFQGAAENAREVKLDRYEIKKRLAEGKSAWGQDESDIQQKWIRRAAAANSTNSFQYLSLFPWFNLVKHEFHGVALKKYYETRPGEEEWGFSLKWPEDKA